MFKILFITNGCIGSNDATGQMLKNIFGNMNDVNILQYTLRPIEEIDCPEVNLLRISNKYYGILPFVYKKIEIISRNCKNKDWSYKIILNLLRAIGYLIEICPIHINKKILGYVKDFNPDIIYTLGADIRNLRICNKLATKFNIPIVVHNMDDFFNFKFSGKGLLNNYGRKLLRQQYLKAYSKSNASLAIGPAMCKEYTKEFGIPFDWIMNCVDGSQLIEQGITLNKKPELLIFSGGLHGGRVSTLIDIAKYIENSSYKLEIYTGSVDFDLYNDSFSIFNRTKLMPYVDRENMFNNLKRADILLHVESFKENYIKYFRLSMSTKIPEYMFVQRPIFCIGPKQIATVKFIENNNIGMVLDDLNNFCNSLNRLQNIDLRQTYIKNAYNLYKIQFTKDRMQKKMYEIFERNLKKQ